MIALRDAEIAALAERAALVQGLEEDRRARQAEMESIQARFGEMEADNRRLAEERDRALALASELRAGLEEREAAYQEQARVILGRDAEVAALAERGFGRSIGRGAGSSSGRDGRARAPPRRDRKRPAAAGRGAGPGRGPGARACARLDERDAVVASLGSRLTELLAAREGGREAAMLRIRDQLSARQDDIQAMVSRLVGTVDYLGMVRRVRADMRRLLPPAARVIVISKGDPDLLDIEGHEAWHFPQDDRGHYAGHYPAESGEAIAHLEALRARGGRFLVIPSSASWWLVHYADLAHHLDTDYQKIWKSADCQIYELERPFQSRQVALQQDPLPAAKSELAEGLCGELHGTPEAASLSITATPAPPAPEPGSILATCDMPGPDPTNIGPGHLRVRGWALSKAGIEDVRVLIDGIQREGLTYGAVRFDVGAVHPEFPDAHHSGFIGRIDLEGLAEGEHCLVVRARGRDGREIELVRSFRLDLRARPDRWDLNAEYPVWLAQRLPSESDLARMRIAAENLSYRPKISLVVPVYNTPEEYLSPMVDSVIAQIYDKWELCLADDGSTAPHVRPFLRSAGPARRAGQGRPFAAEPGDFPSIQCRPCAGHGGVHRAPRP